MTVARDQSALQHQVNTAKINLEDALYLFRGSENDPLATLDIEQISLDTLIADEAGWVSGAGDDLILKDGSLVIGDGAATLAEYTAKNYKNARFNFTMRAEVLDPELSSAKGAWVGIYLRQDKTGWCWTNNNTASMLDLKQNLIQYQQFPAPAGWGGNIKDDMVRNDAKIELGKTYQVAVGIYDTKVDGQVYLELTLNGEKIYSQVVLGTGMYGKEGHFAISAGENTRVVVAPAKADLTEPTKSSPFSDILGHWAEKDITAMYERKIVSGVTDTTFEPDRAITRAEFATLMGKALNLKAANSAGFRDVAEGAWYASSVNAAAAAGLITGYDGAFRPEDLITREEMAVIIAKAYTFLGKTAEKGGIDKFADAGSISDWAKDSVDLAATAGLISGVTESEFRPRENATRAQCVSILARLLK